MSDERRAAPRHQVPDEVTADVSGVAVRLIELSLVGGKVEHHDRFALAAPQLTITWRGTARTLAVRAARSEIVGRQGERLVYQTGISFPTLDPEAQGFVASILGDTQAVPATPKHRPETRSADDSWTRQVSLLRHEVDEELPFAQFRLTPTGWQKEYVASPAQPTDGFTIRRDRRDFDELQRTFDAADPETRRMMQIALESQESKER